MGTILSLQFITMSDMSVCMRTVTGDNSNDTPCAHFNGVNVVKGHS